MTKQEETAVSSCLKIVCNRVCQELMDQAIDALPLELEPMEDVNNSDTSDISDTDSELPLVDDKVI